MSNKEITCEIKKQVAVLAHIGKQSTIEVNMISWNGAPAKLDIRKWTVKEGKRLMLRGVSLDKEASAALALALEGVSSSDFA